MLKAKLVVVGGDAKAKEVFLKLPTIIGRGKDVTLTLPHALVSRRHTEVFERDGWLFVRDLKSLNGTYVNNRRIKDAQKLPPNHLLTLGNVTFRAVYDAPQPVTGSAETVGRRNEDETINFEEIDNAPIDERDTLPESEPAVAEPSASPAGQPLANSNGAIDDRADAPQLRADAPSEPAPVGLKHKSVDANPSAVEAHADDLATPPAAESGSSIFSGGEDFLTPEKSISISALEALPSQATPSSISFVGKQLKEIAGVEKPIVDSVDLDVQGDSPVPVQSDADLGSFLKKLPR